MCCRRAAGRCRRRAVAACGPARRRRKRGMPLAGTGGAAYYDPAAAELQAELYSTLRNLLASRHQRPRLARGDYATGAPGLSPTELLSALTILQGQAPALPRAIRWPMPRRPCRRSSRSCSSRCTSFRAKPSSTTSRRPTRTRSISSACCSSSSCRTATCRRRSRRCSGACRFRI